MECVHISVQTASGPEYAPHAGCCELYHPSPICIIISTKYISTKSACNKNKRQEQAGRFTVYLLGRGLFMRTETEMPFNIIRNDITKVSADAIVNTANPRPVIGEGTDSAIYEAAGRDALLAERRRIGDIAPGSAAVTGAYGLDAKYIIHTVGPAWIDGRHGEFDTLRSCYRESLLTADSLGCRSIAFPLISTGVYGFPRSAALDIAIETISAFLKISDMEVTLVVFDKSAFDLSEELLESVDQFIDEHYVEEQRTAEYPHGIENARSRRAVNAANAPQMSPKAGAPGSGGIFHRRTGSLDMGRGSAPDFDLSIDSKRSYPAEKDAAAPEHAGEDIEASAEPTARGQVRRPREYSEARKPVPSPDQLYKQLGETFQERLLHLIDIKGFTDAQVYKRANVDRKLFSKIRCNPNYKPSKRTALAFAIALGLNLDETTDLLKRAGLALSPSILADLLVRYCIENRIFDIYEVNKILFEYDQQLLGC